MSKANLKNTQEKSAFSLPELAARYGFCTAHLRNEAKAGELKVTRFGRRVVVLKEDWDAYVKSRPTGLRTNSETQLPTADVAR